MLAMAMLKEFTDGNTDEDHPLYGLSIGIGIGIGHGIGIGIGIGIAGQIGPPEQNKVGVFGAVVNQAS